MRDLSILIVGGGIGGLTSAIALRRCGFDVTVIERDPAWSVYGVGLAIEDSLVLAEELSRNDDMESALTAYRERRFERCAYVVRSSVAICKDQLGDGPPVDNAKATAEMSARIAQPI